MSDYIPFEIQLEIIKRLPVKSLVQFRYVSKQWKSFIDYPEFIKTYHINHPNPQHHLLVRSEINYVQTYTSIIDDNTFPQQKFPLTTPEPLNKLRYTTILGSVDGLICFHGLYKDIELETWIVGLWNPSVRKCVGIPVTKVFDTPHRYTRIGFGVCRDTSDPKLVKINVVKTPSICWEVHVFTLSSRVWKIVYTGAPFKLCELMWDHVFVDGIIYWWGRGSSIISFDLKSEKFGEVCLSDRLVNSTFLVVVKVNESLGLLQYYREGGMSFCGVWMRKGGVNQPFTKIYTVKVDGKSVLNKVLGFRNNGEVVMKMEDDDFEKSQIEVYKTSFQKSEILVYEPSSGRINGVGIKGDFVEAKSYMETLLLLDQSNSIVY